MNILSITGGGSRGIIACRLLLEIERVTNVPIHKLFDFMGGTSVGTLIISGITVSANNKTPILSMEQLYQIFLTNLSKAFTWTYKEWLLSGFGLYGPKYNDVGLNTIINEICLDKPLSSLLTNICFPAYDKITSKAYYFDKIKDSSISLKDVILSCTAAPTYFPSKPITINNKKYDMVDGGIVVNNTAELSFLQATKHLSIIDKQNIFELCIGTGKFEYGNVNKDGIMSWAPMIVDTIMNGAAENELYELSLTLPRENYFVMDFYLDINYDFMDNTSDKVINYYIEQTEKWINENKDEIIDFCNKLKQNKGL